jgi:hypothetical protein
MSRMWRRAADWYRPNPAVTSALVVVLVSLWTAVYSVSILGALWRLRDPNAPMPILSVRDQAADLVVLGVQLALGMIAITTVAYLRRSDIGELLPRRQGTAVDAAVAWCAAIAAASALALVLDRLSVARFDFSVPAVVESPALAVLTALCAGLREEPLLAALPVLLLVGRMPIGWVMILAGCMRGLLYLFFGGGGFVWAALWGAAAVWVYFKYRRLWVLVVVHGIVMNIQVLDRVIPLDSAATLLQWANILIMFGALTMWLVPRALGGIPSTPVSDPVSDEVSRPTTPPVER